MSNLSNQKSADGATPRKRRSDPVAKAPRAGKVGTARAAREPESTGWRRQEADLFTTQELGARIRAVREGKGLSLAALSELCGVPPPTLSRIEGNKMSPTFGVLARVMVGLGIDWGSLLSPAATPAGQRLVSFAEPGEGTTTSVRESIARVLHSDNNARALPLLVEVHTPHLEDVGGLASHTGEEFCYVLSGTLVLHIQGEAPRIMKAGASALFDSSIPHAYVAGASGSASLLIVSQRPPGFQAAQALPA